MIEYEYESLFAHHTRASVLIVQHGAELEWNSTTHEFDVTSSDYVIKNSNIDSESLNLDEKLCSRDNLKFGLCESANLEFIIYNREIPNLKDEVIDVYVYFNNDGDTLFQVGVYQVDEDTYSAGRTQRNISAYDWNFQLNGLDITKWYNNFFSDNQRHTINSIVESLFAWVKSSSGGDVPVDLETGYELCNGTFSVGKTIESDTITFGYFMEGLLEFNGAFGHISRTGTFKFIKMEWYDKEPVRVITDRHRYPPTNYDDVNTWGIGQIDVYDRTNVKKFSVQNTNKRHPSIYVMVDPWIIADRDAGDTDVLEALTKMHNVVNHYNYNPSETECSGDLCVEVGDRINVEFRPSTGDTRTWFRSYVLERHFSGLQGMVDVYSAKGDKKQPKYKITNDRWHVGDSSSGLSNISSGGVSRVIDDYDEHCIRKDRNKGFRYLDEPSNAVCQLDNDTVKLKWTDPSDLTDDKPVPCIWAKTYIVKREGQPAWNIYEGEIIETSTTRDEYSSDWFEDSDIEENRQYYYSIMPEDTKEDVRWTLCFSVNTYKFVTAPTIEDITMSDSKVVVTYSIPEATYSYIKLVYKKGSIPTSYTDGTAIDILQSSTSQQISGIADGDRYYFVIFTDITSSEPKDIKTIIPDYPIVIKEKEQTLSGNLWSIALDSFILPANQTYLVTCWVSCPELTNMRVHVSLYNGAVKSRYYGLDGFNVSITALIDNDTNEDVTKALMMYIGEIDTQVPSHNYRSKIWIRRLR